MGSGITALGLGTATSLEIGIRSFFEGSDHAVPFLRDQVPEFVTRFEIKDQKYWYKKGISDEKKNIPRYDHVY